MPTVSSEMGVDRKIFFRPNYLNIAGCLVVRDLLLDNYFYEF